MSDSDDSETAEWEREQMLRGTQSRRHNIQQQQFREEKSTTSIDAALAKKYVNQDIEKEQAKIEAIKRSIGSTKVDIMRYEKRIDAYRKQILVLESNNNLFEELSRLSEPAEVVNFLERNKAVIAKLPHDQKEMITLFEKEMKEMQTPMDTDQ